MNLHEILLSHTNKKELLTFKGRSHFTDTPVMQHFVCLCFATQMTCYYKLYRHFNKIFCLK